MRFMINLTQAQVKRLRRELEEERDQWKNRAPTQCEQVGFVVLGFADRSLKRRGRKIKPPVCCIGNYDPHDEECATCWMSRGCRKEE